MSLMDATSAGSLLRHHALPKPERSAASQLARQTRVTVLPGEKIPGAAKRDESGQLVTNDGRAVEGYPRLPLEDALQVLWPTDAHIQLVQVTGEDAGLPNLPRVNKSLLPLVRESGEDLELQILLVDHDNPNHEPHVDRQSAEAMVGSLIGHPRFPAAAAYATRAGARAIHVLEKPVPVEEGERILRELIAATGGDPAAKDWGRLFRLANVLRDGVQTEDEDYFALEWNDNAEFLDVEALPDIDLPKPSHSAKSRPPVARDATSVPNSIYSLPLRFPNPVPAGSRNNLLFRLACLWRSLGGDVEGITEHLKWVRDRYCAESAGHSVSDAEIESIARSACRYDQGRPRYRLTDIGNAQRFADDHRDAAFFCEQTKSWHVWDGSHWVQDLTGALTQQLAVTTVREMERQAAALVESGEEAAAREGEKKNGFAKTLEEYARSISTRAKLNAMIELSRGMLLRDVGELDRDRYLLNFRNGTVDLRTGKLREHDPGDLITRVIDLDFDPDAEAPRFLETLERVQPDREMRGYIQRGLGYTLVGDPMEQCFFINVGTGANGKSTILNAVRHALAPYACAADIEVFLHKPGGGASGHNEPIANLRGKRMVLASEPDQSRRWSERLLKELTGGESITASRKHEHEITFKPTFVPWFAANFRPSTSGRDPAFFRRMRVIPWGVTVPKEEQDPKLPGRLEQEAPGILAWLIRGALDYQERGLGPTPVAERATAEYQEENDPIGQFVEECCEVGPEARSTFRDVYRRYQTWRQESGEEEVSPKAFSQAIRQAVPAVQAGVKVKGQKCFSGLGLCEEAKGGSLFEDGG